MPDGQLDRNIISHTITPLIPLGSPHRRRTMKFSSSLQFNAVPEWRSHYIDYEGLKKLIYQLERDALPHQGGDEEEATGLVTRDAEAVFREVVNREVYKVNSFFSKKEAEAHDENDSLRMEVHDFESEDLAIQDQSFRDSQDGGFSSDEDEPPSAQPTQRRRRLSLRRLDINNQEHDFRRMTLRKRIVRHYVTLVELLNFADLNRTGLRKALKKFDKVMGASLLPVYTSEILEKVHAFSIRTHERLNSRIEWLVGTYAKLCFEGDFDKAQETLKGYLREHVIYERNTVWRDLIALEHRNQGVNAEVERSPSSQISALKTKILWLSIAFGSFALLLLIPTFKSLAQSRCFAVVVLASILWATEALPLFVTGLLVPFLVIILQIPMNADGEQLSAPDAATFVFSQMWSPVITILVGGFTLAAALSKYGLAKELATAVLSRVGHTPGSIALALMLVAAFMCMWISNVAAPVLVYSVATPVLRTVPTGDPFGKALVLGVALASDIGGILSPISSPQNIIALQNMEPEASWLQWFTVALPVGFCSILGIWMMLMATFPPSAQAKSMAKIRHHHDPFNRMQWFVVITTLVTIILWCLNANLTPYTGGMGVLALVPVVLLFGCGALTQADFNNFLWTIVALAMGGVVLGKAVESCGLLASAATAVQAQIQDLSLFAVVCLVGFLILVVASFVSHTVAALIVIPLVRSIGEQLDDGHPRLLVMLSAMICSAAMALPTSGLPNVTAVCMVDEFGSPYLTAVDFITRGVPASLLSFAIIVVLGFVLCVFVGF